jgi:hypothetical protein
MNLLGIVLILLLASCFALWVMNLVRTGHLYVGYAVVAVMAVAAGVLGLSVGPIRRMAVGGLERLFPGLGIAVASAIVLALALVYVLTQLTIVSNRIAAMAQEIAIQAAGPPRRTPAVDDAVDRGDRPSIG